MKTLNKCKIPKIYSASLKLSVCEVAVLMCTRNLQSMSSKLLLQVGDPEIRFCYHNSTSTQHCITTVFYCIVNEGGQRKKLISGSPTCRRSLELILCGFQVHMSTATSQTESFKLALEIDL